MINSIKIKDSVLIEVRRTILKDITIESSSVVAVSAVVTKDAPAHTLVGGVPAKIIRESRLLEII